MNGLIRASLGNPYAVTVMSLTLIVLGSLSIFLIPIDILPIFRSPAVQTLTFYNGMSATSIAHDITNRMERWTGQANGMARQESRSILGASIVRNYFQGDVDPNGALTQVNSLALAAIPNLPPGTLPPVVLPYDPTSTTPVCVVAVDSDDPANNESVLYDVGRYEVRNMIMGQPGAVAPVVYGGKVRAVMAYLDRQKMQARNLSAVDVMNALNAGNVFLPTGDAKFGDLDFVIDSNSMYQKVEDMGDIPVRIEQGNATYLKDVATPKDANYIQTNVVRVDGKREVYIPVFRQLGASTLRVVNNLRDSLKEMEGKLTRSGINLKLVLDQSVYVQKSIEALVQEGLLGAVLCSLVILMFLGEWRMTGIAIMTLPISCLACCAALYFTGQTINTMTLAGMTLAIGPMIDSAIICLENTHRHLGMGVTPREAAFLGASEVAMPELVSTLCTFLVLSPLVLTPGLGQFLFKPMAMAVAFSMIAAYLLSRTLVPACSAFWLKPHASHDSGGGDHAHGSGEEAPKSPAEAETFQINGNGQKPRGNIIARAFHRWERMIDTGIEYYVKGLDFVLRHRIATLVVAYSLLALTIVFLWPMLRKEFFPEVDAGSFEMYVRAPSGLRIEETEKRIAAVEDYVRQVIDKEDLQLVLSELGVTADWSAAYTPNAGTMDAVVKIQLTAGAEEISPGIRGRAAPGCRRQVRVQRPGICLRRRRHGPLGDERGQVHADQHPGDRQGPEDRAPDRLDDAERDHQDRRRGGRPDHPAARLSAVSDQRRSGQVGSARADAGRRHEGDHRRAQLEHPVQQDQLLDRPGEQEPVLRGRLLSREGHQVDRYRTRHSDHQPGPETGGADAERREDRPAAGGDRGHSLQHPADDRADHGRVRARPRARLRGRRQGAGQVRQAREVGTVGNVRPRQQREATTGWQQDRAQRRVSPHEGHVQQPGRGPLPGLTVDLLPDGRAGPFVSRAPDGHVDRAPVPDRHHADALPDQVGGQRPVAAGLHLHRRHQGGQLGADDRLLARAPTP